MIPYVETSNKCPGFRCLCFSNIHKNKSLSFINFESLLRLSAIAVGKKITCVSGTVSHPIIRTMMSLRFQTIPYIYTPGQSPCLNLTPVTGGDSRLASGYKCFGATLVTACKIMWHHKVGDHNWYLHQCDSFKSYIQELNAQNGFVITGIPLLRWGP